MGATYFSSNFTIDPLVGNGEPYENNGSGKYFYGFHVKCNINQQNVPFSSGYEQNFLGIFQLSVNNRNYSFRFYDPLPYAFKYSDQALIFSTGARPLTAGAYMFFRYASAIKSFKSVQIFLGSLNPKIFMQLPEFMKFKLKK